MPRHFYSWDLADSEPIQHLFKIWIINRIEKNLSIGLVISSNLIDFLTFDFIANSYLLRSLQGIRVGVIWELFFLCLFSLCYFFLLLKSFHLWRISFKTQPQFKSFHWFFRIHILTFLQLHCWRRSKWRKKRRKINQTIEMIGFTTKPLFKIFKLEWAVP